MRVTYTKVIADGMRLDEENRVIETSSSAWNEGYLATLLILCGFHPVVEDVRQPGIRRPRGRSGDRGGGRPGGSDSKDSRRAGR